MNRRNSGSAAGQRLQVGLGARDLSPARRERLQQIKREIEEMAEIFHRIEASIDELVRCFESDDPDHKPDQRRITLTLMDLLDSESHLLVDTRFGEH